MSRPIDDPSAEPATGPSAAQPAPDVEPKPSAEREPADARPAAAVPAQPAAPDVNANPYATGSAAAPDVNANPYATNPYATGPAGAGLAAGRQFGPVPGQQAWPPYVPGAPGAPVPPPFVPQPKAKVSGMAVASFVLGLIGFLPPLSLVSMGLALGSFGRIFRRRQGGFGFAAVGLMFSVTWTLFVAMLGGIMAFAYHDLTSGPTRGADGHPVVAGRAGSWYLQAGDCAVGDIHTYRSGSDHYQVVPCAQPHRLEVFASVTLPGNGSYPGVASVEASARRMCQDRASSADLPEDGMIGYFYPSQGRWWLFDDREALCVYSSLTPWSGQVKSKDSGKPGSPV
ncbi:hypothetical protein ACFXDE_11355 [Kitasatospora sp. NPDC059408]|uniref:DUF4190 domain-containing protein n=1 Tax=Kitasatospora sp. NPDC059408 TaxID=3346823 RepID=UPI0036BC67C3